MDQLSQSDPTGSRWSGSASPIIIHTARHPDRPSYGLDAFGRPRYNPGCLRLLLGVSPAGMQKPRLVQRRGLRILFGYGMIPSNRISKPRASNLHTAMAPLVPVPL